MLQQDVAVGGELPRLSIAVTLPARRAAAGPILLPILFETPANGLDRADLDFDI